MAGTLDGTALLWYSTFFCLKPFVYISQQQHELLVLAADKMFIGPCQTQNLQKEL